MKYRVKVYMNDDIDNQWVFDYRNASDILKHGLFKVYLKEGIRMTTTPETWKLKLAGFGKRLLSALADDYNQKPIKVVKVTRNTRRAAQRAYDRAWVNEPEGTDLWDRAIKAALDELGVKYE